MTTPPKMTRPRARARSLRRTTQRPLLPACPSLCLEDSSLQMLFLSFSLVVERCTHSCMQVESKHNRREDDGDAEEDEDPRSSPTTTMHRTVPPSWLSPIAPFPLQYYSICFHCFSPSFAHFLALHFFVCKCSDHLHMAVSVLLLMLSPSSCSSRRGRLPSFMACVCAPTVGGRR